MDRWQQAIMVGDVLQRYREKELKRLVEETGIIDKMPYEFMLKTLDLIEIESDGTAEEIFLSGIRVGI